MKFDDFHVRAAGVAPYPYQRRLAEDGLPQLLRAPTGAGKTAAAVLPWLWRRRMHPNGSVRAQMPRWLIVALPMRTLVDQVHGVVGSWLNHLGLTEDVGLHVLMGGAGAQADAWRDTPARDAILVGSIDMLLSRALNRGYASGRFLWPIDFGMVNNGAQWVFDEVQLFGPALATSRQLQAFRDSIGTVLPTRSMWMSATVGDDWLQTVDSPQVGRVLEVDERDRATAPLQERLAATKRVERLDLDGSGGARDLAAAIEREHRPGTRTLVFLNTVDRAQGVAVALGRSSGVPTVLVHSRFRPDDRQAALARAIAGPGEAGLIVVSTQALEAGVDITSGTLVTETAPWSSIVQRAGRCNRYGETADARLLWTEPTKAPPYEEEDLTRAAHALTELEGQPLTAEQFAAQPVDEHRPLHAVLRRKDLVELFDTTPDLSGDDLDVGVYIRDSDDRDVFLAWRDVDERPEDEVHLEQHELCSVPIADARRFLQTQHLWHHDHLTGRWERTNAAGLRPGLVLLASLAAGGYTVERGWDRTSRGPVRPVETVGEALSVADEEATDADRLSTIGVWVTLGDHLEDAARETRGIFGQLGLDPAGSLGQAAIRAAHLHDLGKAHPNFQEFLHAAAGEDETPRPDLVWAKSSRARRSRHRRRHFRHELVSALALMTEEGRSLLESVEEADLAIYLVGAHHGRVRLGMRSLERDTEHSEGRQVVLGVVDREPFGPVTLPSGDELPAVELPLSQSAAFGGEGSWTRLALALRDRHDLGIFRLGFLEAVVRLGDWTASRRPSRPRTADGEEVDA